MDEVQLTRRATLGGGVATLISLMAARGGATAAARLRSDDPRYAFTERLCDLVIPKTGTPGGGQAGAAPFVLLAIDAGMNGLDGGSLQAVREALRVDAGADFLTLAPEKQTHLLETLDARAFAGPRANQPGPAQIAWRQLKPAIVAGYYTSEIGAARELVYEPVPGPERGSFTLGADYRSRSNEGFGGTL